MAIRNRDPYHCYLCRRELNRGGILFNDIPATIRVFSGVPAGAGLAGGYAACDRHTNEAIQQAMTPLLKLEKTKYKTPEDWTVTCYRIERDTSGQNPRLGRTLFIARQRLFRKDLRSEPASWRQNGRQSGRGGR